MKLNAQQLRELEEKRVMGEIRQVKRNPIYFILENIYDTYNIGGLFRLADALAIKKIYLVGDTEIPPNSRIKKASIGTYKVVNWLYKKTTKDAIDDLSSKFKVQSSKLQLKTQKEKNLGSNIYHLTSPQIIAVEQHPNAINYTAAVYRLPLALIFGNESYGITKETLNLADQIVEIPMWGINRSLNVIVSAAIVSYYAMTKLNKQPQ